MSRLRPCSFGSRRLADAGDHLVEGDVLVVLAAEALRSRGEDRLGQLVRLAQAFGQLDAADCSGGLIVLPSGAGEIAAHDALDGEHLRPLDQHGCGR